jgi:SAM-dependent methyltransferase
MADAEFESLVTGTDLASLTPNSRILFEKCPLCASRKIAAFCKADCSLHPLYNPLISNWIIWMNCSECSHVFTNGYFSPDVSEAIFEKTLHHQKPGYDFEAQRVVSARIVDSVAQYQKTGAWLDVGFGNGSLLCTAEEWGFDPFGIDLRPSSVEAMKKLGIDAGCIDLTALPGHNLFNVISMADVLEHMPFPKDGLIAARRLLAPDGILFISMPSYACAAWRLMDINNVNPYWGEIEHFHNFSRSRLYALTKEMGFEPIHYGISQRYRVCMEVILRPVA